MNRNRIFKQRRLFFIALGIFLLINLGAIFFSWHRRKLPPEPDDAGAFILLLQGNIKYKSVFSSQFKVLNRPFVWNSYGGMDKATYFSWAFFWGKFANLFSLKPEFVLKLSFYFGIVFFLVSAIYFFKEKDWRFKTILVLVLAFFTGDGTYQGFFWPVSSLYSIVLFLIIIKVLLDGKKYWFIKTVFLLPVFLLLHPLSIVSLFSIPTFIFLSRFMSKNKNLNVEKRLFVALLLDLFFSFGWFKFLSLEKINLLANTNIVYSVVSRLKNGQLSFSKQAVGVIANKYFLYLLTRPLLLSLFILGIIRISKQNRNLFFLYCSFVPLALAGLLFDGGERIILFVWLLTFFIFAFGLSFLIELLGKIVQSKISLKKEKKLAWLIWPNFLMTAFFALFILKPNCDKNVILRNFFLASGFFLLLMLLTNLVLKKKTVLILAIFGLINFFIFLSLEKAAMIVFQRKNANFKFNKNIFLPKIDANKEGVIIYNDNLSFALFSAAGLIEREAFKREFLKKGDLEKAAYFVSLKRKFKECQERVCWLEDRGVKKQMRRKATDDNFLLYEFLRE